MIEREFAIQESPLVKIAIRSGRISVEPGDQGLARFIVETRDPTFQVIERGDALVASGERTGRVDLKVSVPASAEAEISTASGDIAIGTDLARLEVSTASGETVFDTIGRLTVRTASGGVRGDRVRGDLRVTSASGDVRISEVADRAEISTASGDVLIDLCAGSFTCATVSGDVVIREMRGPSLDVKSMSGGVTVGIPSRTRLDLDANSLSGRIKLPAPNPSPEPPEREMGARVRLVSGDLRIERVTQKG